MRRIPKLVRVVSALSAAALIATACGSSTEETGGTEGEGTETEGEGTEGEGEGEGEGEMVAGGTVSTYIGEPDGLVPINNNESEGNAVLDTLFTGLITYDPATSQPAQGVAESITSDDGGKTWTIVLQDGWTFHDGEAVTADSFINAWNYAAYGPNAQQNSGFMADIAGFEEVNPGTDDDDNPIEPTAETLSGLTKVDDLTFTAELSEPLSFWNTKLGYTAYFPLPSAFYDDPAAFNEAPIGNGPFKIDGVWEHDVAINVVRNDAYPLGAPSIDGIEFRIYADVDTAINDLLAGNLDIVDSVTAERSDEVRGQMGDTNFGESSSSSINYLGFPMQLDKYNDNKELRQAISMAIDQEAITTAIFNNGRQPAYNLLSPVIPGYQERVCDNWGYDPAAAAAKFEEAGGADALGEVTFWFNAGAGHDAWVEAVVNQLGENLGIDTSAVKFEQLQFADYLDKLDNKEVDGPFRLGWGMDYPHPQNYWQLLLDSRFAFPVGANTTFWDNADFDGKLDEALAIADLDQAIPVYQEVAAIACEEVPLIPMFYGKNQFSWNSPVDSVVVDAFGRVDWTQITKGA